MSLRAGLVIAATACAMMACSDGHGGGGKRRDPRLIFDPEVAKAYASVRSCRSPGEHSGINAFTVWVSRDAKAVFESLWQTPPAEARMPDGAVVVKEIYAGLDCKSSEVDKWVAMRKEAGFDPAHADWHWQSLSSNGEILMDGATAECIDCHEGNESCAVDGEANGRDYLCTEP